MAHQMDTLHTHLQQKQLVKVIAGIDNTNLDNVSQVVRAATAAQAGAVDVAADEAVIKRTRELTDLPVFASSVTPEALADAIAWGAHVAELGNFDALYKEGFYLPADDVLQLTRDTLALLPEGSLLSTTIPGYLSTEAQVQMAQKLQALGVHMIQTEGACRVVSTTKQVELLSAEEKATLTFKNTQAICHAVTIPVMTASGISRHNVMAAFALGAAAVGIGSAVNKLSSETAMHDELQAIMDQVQHHTAELVS